MAFPHPGPGSASSCGSGFQHLNSPFGDTTYTKVFVGGLAWETRSETLGRHFGQFGEILEAVVISDKNTGRSKGYGFVTFRDPESAKRACEDPTPVIDGRRANCNLASFGRPRPLVSLVVRPRPGLYVGGVSVQRGPYVGSPAHQQSVPFNYQEGLPYPPPYSYNLYGPEYVYPQNVYNPYMGQHYVQVYGLPGPVNTSVYPFDQFGQPISGGPGYTAIQGYQMPPPPVLQLGASNTNVSAPRPVMQAPYPAGLAAPVPAQPHFILPAHSPQFVQGTSSDQTTV